LIYLFFYSVFELFTIFSNPVLHNIDGDNGDSITTTTTTRKDTEQHYLLTDLSLYLFVHLYYKTIPSTIGQGFVDDAWPRSSDSPASSTTTTTTSSAKRKGGDTSSDSSFDQDKNKNTVNANSLSPGPSPRSSPATSSSGSSNGGGVSPRSPRIMAISTRGSDEAHRLKFVKINI
jgi:hypothetical protein